MSSLVIYLISLSKTICSDFDDDIQTIESDDDQPQRGGKGKKGGKSTIKQSPKSTPKRDRKGVAFSSDEDEEEEFMRPPKRRR